MKERIYVETTVVSCFTARPSRDLMVAGHQEATRELWPAGAYLGNIPEMLFTLLWLPSTESKWSSRGTLAI